VNDEQIRARWREMIHGAYIDRDFGDAVCALVHEVVGATLAEQLRRIRELERVNDESRNDNEALLEQNIRFSRELDGRAHVEDLAVVQAAAVLFPHVALSPTAESNARISVSLMLAERALTSARRAGDERRKREAESGERKGRRG